MLPRNIDLPTLLRQADAVFIHIDDGMRSWAWIRGFPEVPAKVQIQYGQDEEDKRAVRHLTIKMGLTEKEWKKAIAQRQVLPGDPPTPITAPACGSCGALMIAKDHDHWWCLNCGQHQAKEPSPGVHYPDATEQAERGGDQSKG